MKRAFGALAIAAIVAAGCSNDMPRSEVRTDTAIRPSTGLATDTAPASASLTASNDRSHVGLRYDPLPDGVTYVEGSAVLDARGTPTGFSLSHVRTPNGDAIWLDSLLPNDGATRARVVRAELSLPALALSAHDELFLGSCDVSGALDGRVVAVAEDRATNGRFTAIRQAWRPSSASGRFEPVPAASVSCENP